ncbi:MAG TPA: small basic protein [Phycisphaerales bacterium]|nr:small basic protein [Phycisphaerales bacterium]
MSLHRSLKTKPSALNQHRNVLTRAERITKLSDTERFNREKNSPLGLVKVANRMAHAAKKEKKEATEEGATAVAGAPAAAGAAAPAGAKGAAAAPAGKGAAPAAGKAAAPAAKGAAKK